MTAPMPLIVRVALARDWEKAFEIVFVATFMLAANEMGLPANEVGIEMAKPAADWDERRAICRGFAQRLLDDYGEPAIAAAWAMLAANPAPQPARTGDDQAMLGLALTGLAGAITAEPALLNDDAFFHALSGWRFIELVGVARPLDAIAAAQAVGATVTLDRDDMLAWATTYAELK
jgi:hypothetical protein